MSVSACLSIFESASVCGFVCCSRITMCLDVPSVIRVLAAVSMSNHEYWSCSFPPMSWPQMNPRAEVPLGGMTHDLTCAEGGGVDGGSA